MVTEKKITKKDLKEPDEFINFTERFLDYCAKNKKLVIGSLVSIFLAAVALMGFLIHSEKKMQQMEALLFEMKQIGLNGDKKSRDITSSFEIFLKDFAESPQKKRAKLLLADKYYRNSEPDKSAKIYKEIMGTSEKGEMIYDFAELGLGYSLELSKNTKQAIGVFKAIIARESKVPLFYVYLALVRAYESNRDSINALLILREMEIKFRTHSEFAVVQNKISLLEKKA